MFAARHTTGGVAFSLVRMLEPDLDLACKRAAEGWARRRAAAELVRGSRRRIESARHLLRSSAQRLHSTFVVATRALEVTTSTDASPSNSLPENVIVFPVPAHDAESAELGVAFRQLVWELDESGARELATCLLENLGELEVSDLQREIEALRRWLRLRLQRGSSDG